MVEQILIIFIFLLIFSVKGFCLRSANDVNRCSAIMRESDTIESKYEMFDDRNSDILVKNVSASTMAFSILRQ